MAAGLLEQSEHPDYQSLGFEDRLGLLVDQELLARENHRLERILKSARLLAGVTQGKSRELLGTRAMWRRPHLGRTALRSQLGTTSRAIQLRLTPIGRSIVPMFTTTSLAPSRSTSSRPLVLFAASTRSAYFAY